MRYLIVVILFFTSPLFGGLPPRGNLYNNRGIYSGRITPNGTLYNYRGAYQGRYSPYGNSYRFYDSRGRYSGQLRNK